MSLETEVNRVSYAGNGATTAFSFPYYFLASADLVVISRVNSTGVETTQVITTNYTVTGAGVAAGGTVTMLVAPATGTTLTIYRDPAPTQGLDLAENDALPAESLERALDRSAMVNQRLKDRVGRSVQLSEGFSTSFTATLPPLITGNALLKFNSAGTGFENGPDATVVTAGAAAASASASAASGSASAANASAIAAAASAASVAASDSKLVNVVVPSSGRAFEVASTTGGFIGPRMTTVQRDLITPVAGLEIFNSTTGTKQIYTTAWTDVGSGGGGSAVFWLEDGATAIPAVDSSNRVYQFTAAFSQTVFALVRVPTSYLAGSQVRLRLTAYSADTSGTYLMQTVSTLIRTGTDLISSTTNQRTSTNAAITATGGNANRPQAIVFDLTSATGQINAVSV
jgi:hypothetical protein